MTVRAPKGSSGQGAEYDMRPPIPSELPGQRRWEGGLGLVIRVIQEKIMGRASP